MNFWFPETSIHFCVLFWRSLSISSIEVLKSLDINLFVLFQLIFFGTYEIFSNNFLLFICSVVLCAERASTQKTLSLEKVTLKNAYLALGTMSTSMIHSATVWSKNISLKWSPIHDRWIHCLSSCFQFSYVLKF